ncbi:hypothetical protein SAVIM338S_00909 [Streptomyces avidinii]
MEGRFTLSPGEERLRPSPEDVAFYRNHGWFLTPPLFTERELASVREAGERFYRGERDRLLPIRPSRTAYWQPGDGDGQRHNDYIAYESDAVRTILCKPLVGAIAARLIGTPSVRLWSSTLIHKPSDPDEPSNVVPWHTDRHHWQVCTSDDLITAFIPLHDCDVEHGTLTVLDSSHTWDDLPPQPGDDPNRHFAGRPRQAMDSAVRAAASYNGATVQPVPLRFRAGQVSFHHCRTYHGSGPNLSGSPRQVVTIRFQEASNRWRPVTDPSGSPVVYSHDSLVRRTDDGHPDYSDPEFCPVLWSDDPRPQHP